MIPGLQMVRVDGTKAGGIVLIILNLALKLNVGVTSDGRVPNVGDGGTRTHGRLTDTSYTEPIMGSIQCRVEEVKSLTLISND